MIRLNKKLVYLFAVLVAGLFVISSCSQQEAVGVRARNLDLGEDNVPVLPGDNERNIKANSCNNDEVCEINSIKMEYLSIDGKTISTRRTSNLILNAGGDGNSDVVIGDLYLQGKTIGSTEGHALILKGGSGIVIDGETSFDRLTGEGNAYVCLNNQGKLFRSNNPCR